MASRLLTKAFKKGKNNFENACQLEPAPPPPNPPPPQQKSKQTNETQEDISLEFFLFLVLGG